MRARSSAWRSRAPGLRGPGVFAAGPRPPEQGPCGGRARAAPDSRRPQNQGQTLRTGAAASASCGRLPSSNGRGPQHTGDDVSSRALETTDPKGTQRARPSFGEGAASPRSNRARRLSAGVLSAFDLETADLVIPRFHQELEGGVWEGEMCLTASARQQGSEIISGKKIRYPDWSFPFSVFTK